MSAIAVDLLVLVVICLKLVPLRHGGFVKGGVMDMLLRGGVQYFGALLLTNATQIIVLRVAKVPYGMSFIAVITSILISRFILNLRRLRTPCNEVRAARFSTLPQSRLSSLLTGNLGEDLSHGLEDEDPDADEDQDLAESLCQHQWEGLHEV